MLFGSRGYVPILPQPRQPEPADKHLLLLLICDTRDIINKSKVKAAKRANECKMPSPTSKGVEDRGLTNLHPKALQHGHQQPHLRSTHNFFRFCNTDDVLTRSTQVCQASNER
jgi:hypothetical protein